jgi:hypothetical protein
LRTYGKNRFNGTTNTLNMKICKLMTNKHENICVGVYWNNDIPG